MLSAIPGSDHIRCGPATTSYSLRRSHRPTRLRVGRVMIGEVLVRSRVAGDKIVFELAYGALFPELRLLQQRGALMRTERCRLPIQGCDGAIAPHVFQNRLSVDCHEYSPHSVPLR